jgi:hypothetical protein
MYHGIPTLVHCPSFQGVKYSADAPSAHHPSWQPVLNETKKNHAHKKDPEKYIPIFPFFSPSNLMERINYIHYLCYLAGMDILHCFRDLHCWSAQVSAILANFLDGEL